MIVHVICCTMAVAQVAGRSFDTRGPRFQSNQMQNWIHVYAVNYSRSVTFDGRFSRYQASLLDCRFIISIFYNSILLLLNLTCSIVRLSLSLESKNLLPRTLIYAFAFMLKTDVVISTFKSWPPHEHSGRGLLLMRHTVHCFVKVNVKPREHSP